VYSKTWWFVLWVTLFGLHKNNNISIVPQIKDFTTNKVVHMCFPLTQIYAIQAHIFRRRIWGTILGAHFLMHIGCILPYIIVWIEFPFLTLFIICLCVGFYKSLGTYCDSYWLVVMHPKFFFWQWAILIGPSLKMF
jgi:hypothetical protein